jgi:hypothetical protein
MLSRSNPSNHGATPVGSSGPGRPDPDGPLPREHDFNPDNDPEEAVERAWQHFGGLSLDQAYAKFCEDPFGYEEDFIFMGGIAFAYYFPVIEKWIRNAPDIEPFGDHEAYILARTIQHHFSFRLPYVRHLGERVAALAKFVHDNIHRFGDDEAERKRVANAWSELVAHITAEGRPG